MSYYSYHNSTFLLHVFSHIVLIKEPVILKTTCGVYIWHISEGGSIIRKLIILIKLYLVSVYAVFTLVLTLQVLPWSQSWSPVTGQVLVHTGTIRGTLVRDGHLTRRKEDKLSQENQKGF